MHYKHCILVTNKCDGPKWKRSHGRHRPGWEGNIKMYESLKVSWQIYALKYSWAITFVLVKIKTNIS